MPEKAKQEKKPLSLEAAAASDVGKVRQTNEDAFVVLPELGLFIVSDGMGGHQAGATASKIVVGLLPKIVEQRMAALRSSCDETISRLLRDTIVELSRKIREQSAGQLGLAGMGATVVLVYIRGEKAFIAHMGDSRAYLYRQQKLKQLTKDHSVVGILLRRGEIPPEEAKKHPARNLLSRYVGMEGEVYPDVQILRLSPRDRLLLCTDGLTGPVPDKTIARILEEAKDPESTCRALIEGANRGGGPDNITVLVLDLVRLAPLMLHRRDTTMHGTVKLKVVKGPIEGKVFTFEEHDTFIFGRSPDCHAQLPANDVTASRHHFILEVNPPDARIRDLGSLSGTYVNGIKYGGRAKSETPEEAAQRKFPEVDLKDGDVIRAGETVFVFQVQLAAVCCDCGRRIADAEKKACEWVAGTYICPLCHEKAAAAAKPPKKPKPVRCKQCGKDVSDEVGGRRGDYICQSCQVKAELDPAAVLMKLLQEYLRGRPEAGAPAISGYEMGKLLGRGAMGAVYLAKRKKDGATVAIKIMLSKVAVNEDARQRFQREIEVTRSLHHPNCVELLDHGSVGSAFYFAMEFCPGGSVDGLMKRRGGKLSLKEAGPIMLQALEGLSYAHEKGFVHRDLKPQNILLTAAERGTAKVSDFGLAKNFQKAGFSGMTITGSVAGTYPFMSREQVINFKYVKPVSDIWSMGATLYFMLTGEFPHDFPRGQDPMEVILHKNIVPIRKRDPSIPRNVAEVIDRAVADNAKDRYQTAAEFRSELAKML